MKKLLPMVLLFVFLIFSVSRAQAPEIELFEWGFNIDGTTYCLLAEPDCNFNEESDLPASMDVTNFDFFTGLGTINITFSTPGDHIFVSWLDLDIDFLANDTDNETAAAVNLPAASGQTWEIDEPGFGSLQDGSAGFPYFGDIFDNFLTSDVANGSSLDNQAFFDVNVPQTLTPPDEVSLAMGWDVALVAGETATITFIVSQTEPMSGFYVVHSDPDSPADVYVSSSLAIVETNNPPSVPQLVAPVDGQTDLNTSVEFKWKKSTDPDGDIVFYELNVCEDIDFSTGCITRENIASVHNKGIYYAGTGMGLSLFGLVFAFSVKERRKIAVLLILIMSIALLSVSCGGGGGGGGENPDDEVSQTISGLNTATTYYWKIIVDDGNGNRVESEVRSFKTLP